MEAAMTVVEDGDDAMRAGGNPGGKAADSPCPSVAAS